MGYISIDSIKGIDSEYNKARFWQKVALTANDDLCWNWIAFKDKDGYGCYRVENKNLRTNRLSYYLHNKKDPRELVVCHKCDNPSCVNPKHLFLGTHKDNINDCWNKGRKEKTIGTKNGQAIIKEKEAQEIITLWESGKFKYKSDVGKLFGLKQPTVSMIINGKTWPHLKRKSNN